MLHSTTLSLRRAMCTRSTARRGMLVTPAAACASLRFERHRVVQRMPLQLRARGQLTVPKQDSEQDYVLVATCS